jgi:putative ABC transport system permease protein
LGAGNGLKNGVTQNFSSQTTNKITMYAGNISKPTNGKKMWQSIEFDVTDSALLNSLTEVEDIIPSYNVWGRISYKKRNLSTSFEAVIPRYLEFENINMTSGRFINDIDVKEQRKVGVIADKDALVLFDNEDPLGKQIQFNGIAFTVVGVYKTRGARWNNEFYAPFSTLSAIFNPSGKIGSFVFTVNNLETIEANEAFEEDLRQRMSRKHGFDVEDVRTVYANHANF